MTTLDASRPFSSLRLDNDDHLAEYVRTRFDSRSTHLADQEQQWCETIAFFLGHQWSQWNRARRRMETRPRPPYRQRLVLNLLLPLVQREVAMHIRAKPTWHALPVTNDYEDVAVSRLQTKLLRAKWVTEDMAIKQIELGTWTATTGNGWVRTVWDPFYGPEMTLRPEDVFEDSSLIEAYQRLAQLHGTDDEGVVHGRLGDVRISVRSPFEIDVDRGAVRASDAMNLIDTQAVPVRWLQDRYPDQDIEGDADTRSMMSRFYFQKIAGMSEVRSGEDFYVGSNRHDQKDYALVHTLYTAPVRGHPKGIFCVVVNDKVRQRGDIPYPIAGPPYDHFQAIRVPGRLYGTCAARHAISPQIDLNKQRSMLSEEALHRGRPKLLIPEGMGIEDADVQEPGKSVRYQPQEGVEPHYMDRPDVPDWIARQGSYQYTDISHIASQHDVSQGVQPGSVRTGRGISELREADATAHLPNLTAHREQLAKVGSRVVATAARFYTEQRLVASYGAEYEVEAIMMTGGDLMGPKQDVPGADYFRVAVKMSSAVPLTPDQRRAQVGELINLGYWNPQDPEHRDLIAQALEMQTTEPFLDQHRLERQNVRRENARLARGEAVGINPWDDDEFHIAEHRHFERMPEFHELPPEVQELHLMHTQLHVLRKLEAFYGQANLLGGGGAASQRETRQTAEGGAQ